MRRAINDNPVAQIALIGVLLVLTGLMLSTRVFSGSKQEEPPSAGGASASSATGLDPSATSTPDATAPEATAPAAAAGPSSAPSGAATVTPEALVPGPGLPKEMVVSWARGDATVLLVVRNGGIDDQLVRRSVRSLSADAKTITTFVIRAKNLARYSRVTEAVGLNRVPALVVIRPRSAGGDVPQAQVSYGFRSSQSIVQAVRDAVYSGKESLPYHPG